MSVNQQFALPKINQNPSDNWTNWRHFYSWVWFWTLLKVIQFFEIDPVPFFYIHMTDRCEWFTNILFSSSIINVYWKNVKIKESSLLGEWMSMAAWKNYTSRAGKRWFYISHGDRSSSLRFIMEIKVSHATEISVIKAWIIYSYCMEWRDDGHVEVIEPFDCVFSMRKELNWF